GTPANPRPTTSTHTPTIRARRLRTFPHSPSVTARSWPATARRATRTTRMRCGFAGASRRCRLPETGDPDTDGVTATPQVGHDRRPKAGGPLEQLDRLAVFDLDRTLIPGASLAALVRELAARRLVARRRLVRAGLEQAIYKRRGSTDAQIERIR